jgi:DNA processing protein
VSGEGAVSAPDRLARAALSRVSEPGRVDMLQRVDQYGATAVWSALKSRVWPAGDPAPADLLARVGGTDPERDLAALHRQDGRLLCPGDAEWPDSLADLDSTDLGAPLALWVRGPGDLGLSVARSAAVVGSRAATGYGAHVAGELGAALAERDCTVVSGGAYGIDAAAHRGALAVGGSTVVILACGVDVPYPRGHESLFGRVAAEGLLVSEWPPGCAPMRHRFLVRNRVIAALTAGTVVVEAAARSGSLSTARHARNLDRAVMAVPGPVTSTMSTGCHALLREPDTTLVTSAAEVLDRIGRIGADMAPLVSGPVLPRDGLGTEARRVLEAVPALRAAGPARIAVAAGVDSRTVLRSLGALRYAGFVEMTAAGWRLTAEARSQSRGAPEGAGA